MRKSTIRTLSAVAVILLSACGGGEGEVIVLNPPDGLPVEAFYGMDVVDLDGDGFADLVAASTFNDGNDNFETRMNVFFQNAIAPGTFSAPARLVYGEPGGSPGNVDAVDLKLDGQHEIVLQEFTDGGSLVFEQDPASPGTLMAPVQFGPPAPGQDGFTGMMAMGDVDGDLLPDVVLTTGDVLVLYPQNGADPGSFLPGIDIGEGSGAIRIADVNGDGLTDLLTFRTNIPDDLPIPDTLLYYRQNPLAPGQFLPPMVLFFDYVGGEIGVADLDGNGLNDMLVIGGKGSGSNSRTFTTIYRQSSPDNFVRVESQVTAADLRLVYGHAIVDIDGDGDLEIIVGLRTGAVFANEIDILTQDAGGSYVRSAQLTIPDDEALWNPELFSFRVADLNDDQQPDIAVSTYELFVFFQETGQPGVFGEATRIAAQR